MWAIFQGIAGIAIRAASLSTLILTALVYIGSYQFGFALVFVAFCWAAGAGIVAAAITQFALMLPIMLLGLLLMVLRSSHGTLARPNA